MAKENKSEHFNSYECTILMYIIHIDVHKLFITFCIHELFFSYSFLALLKYIIFVLTLFYSL